MFFVPKGNRLYRWAVTKNSFMRYCLLFGSAAFFCTTWYFGVYARINTRLKQADMRIVHMRKQCSALGASKKNCELMQAAIDQYNNQLHATSALQKQQSDDFLFVIEQAKKNHLSFGSYAIDTTKDKQWYEKQCVHCSFSGSLPNITSFLSALKHNDRMIQCKQVDLKAGDDAYDMQCVLQMTRVKT